jgi:hypothetical protein
MRPLLLPLLLLLRVATTSAFHSTNRYIASPYQRQDDRIHRLRLLAIKLVGEEAKTSGSSILDHHHVTTTAPATGNDDQEHQQPQHGGAVLSTQSADNAASSLLLTAEEGETTNAFDGLLWRGVVVVLCAVWASNFPAIKLIVAEPGACVLRLYGRDSFLGSFGSSMMDG